MTDRPPGRQTRRRVGPDDGSPSVFVADERGTPEKPDSSHPPVDVTRWSALAEAVLVAEGIRGDAELSILFIDEDEIAVLNERFMDVVGPTDVLSFPIDTDMAEPGRWPDGGTEGPDRVPLDNDDLPLLLGDVVIAPSVALRNAPDHAGTLDDELALLVVHGILHILGMDHAVDTDRLAMQGRERELLAAHHGPLARDPWTELNRLHYDVAGPDGAPRS